MPYTNGCCRTQHTATTTHTHCVRCDHPVVVVVVVVVSALYSFVQQQKNNRQMARLGFKQERDRIELKGNQIKPNQTKSALINSQFVTCVQTTHWLPKKEHTHTHKTLAVVIDANSRGAAAAAAGYWLATLYPTKSTDTETQTLEMGSSDEEGKKKRRETKPGRRNRDEERNRWWWWWWWWWSKQVLKCRDDKKKMQTDSANTSLHFTEKMRCR